ncbi:DMT family transporter [Bradyrhizobium sp. 83012]|uniref:DMT family transporter n=1 Tax=Bradyrhizobium aeschynomenes TaxID=2734909 RepID=A0ABX2C648_9BRAD|nr:DMT family transporter [Bradyrhizobium aeschynomenes]NPU63767.1 DMT family transporter [Bradyrhizobium aeschynomenes]NPV23332.1 DMT family transporter [Bradyrhizobium aeschynomenes]
MAFPNDRMDPRDWSLLGLLSLLWSGSFIFNGLALKELPPLTLVLLRIALAAAILLPILRLRGLGLPKGIAGWRPYFAVALFNNVVPFCLIVIGQTYITSGLAAVLNATTPLFTIAVMAAAGEEGLSARRVAGLIVGLVGVVVLRGGSSVGGGYGILFGLGASFSYGVAALLVRRHLANSPPLATATFQLSASSAMMLVVAGVVDQPWRLPMPGLQTWLAIIALAALSTAFAYIVFFQVLRRSGATNVTLVTLLIPLTTMLLGYLVLGESVSLREIVGALVIGSALLVIDGRIFNVLRAAPRAS